MKLVSRSLLLSQNNICREKKKHICELIPLIAKFSTESKINDFFFEIKKKIINLHLNK